MAQESGKCPGCDQTGKIGEACSEKGCAKRGYHFIPVAYWELVHKDGAAPDPVLGVLIGDFLVVAPIGSGGFGKVFLALQSPIFRLRGALKLLEFPSDNVMLVKALLEKFQGEAEALADLSHPNIVKLLKYGVHAQVPYLVMEYVDDAHTVRREIQIRAVERRPFLHAELRSLFDQILNGLEAAHAQNIIHRDVKPENIMLQRVVGNPMHVKILDFGTAKFVENRADTKWPLGSPSYMAPEQVNLKGIGPWSDLYAVGVMLFELLTGRRPFPGETENEIVAYKMRDDFDPLDALRPFNFPDEVDAFLRKALAKSPEDRYRSASELREALHLVFDAIEGHEGVASTGAELTGLLDSTELAEIQQSSQKTPLPDELKTESARAPVVTDAIPRSSEGSSKFKFVTAILVSAIGVGFGVYAISQWQTDARTEANPIITPQEPVLALPTEDLVHAKDLPNAPDLEADASEDLPPTEVAHRIMNVAAGKFHTCAVVDSKVRCWGANFDGELGIGNTRSVGDKQPAYKAPFVDLGGNVIQVAAAGDRNASSTCAVLENGDLRCWGSNQFGQLGLGHTNSVGNRELPLSVPRVEMGGQVLSVSISGSQYGSHGCALLEGGRVKCWGANRYGQLGYAHTTVIGDDETPATLPDVDVGGVATRVVVGKYHSCAILEEGKLRCWGWNNKGQLGYGHKRTIGDNETPASVKPVPLDEPVKDIALGRLHTCALLESGAIRCWGWNSKGQLGLGHKRDIGDNEAVLSVPPIDIGGEVAQIVAGDNHTCARLVDGHVRCFGENNFGQLGYSHTRNIGDDEMPSIVGNVFLGEPSRYIAAGSYHNCAILESDTLRCWGHNKFGELGYGHTNDIGDNETPVGAGNVPLLPPEE